MKLKLIKLGHYFHIWALQLMPIFIIMLFFGSSSSAYADNITPIRLTMSSNIPSAVSLYDFTFTIPQSETLGSIKIHFCSNSPIVGATCDIPAGFSDSSASLTSQNGISGFTISSNSNGNTLILSRPPMSVASGVVSLNFSNVKNTSSTGSNYVRMQTFPTSDASGLPSDIGGIAYDILYAFEVSTYVPPYLLFCDGQTINGLDCNGASGNLLNFGDLSEQYTSSAQSQFLIATNAANGYAVEVEGTTMTSGNNILPPLGYDSSSVPGDNQFGINLTSNSRPSIGQVTQGPGTGAPTAQYAQPNLFKFNPGDIIASSNQPSDYIKYTVSYIINISNRQAPGVYAATLTYVSVANF